MKRLYNLIRWDAFGDYKTVIIGNTYEYCFEQRLIAEAEDTDKRWHTYEIVPYTER